MQSWRREAIGTPTSQEGTEWSGRHREIRSAPSHHHADLDKPLVSSRVVADTGHPVGSLLTGYAYSWLSAQPRNFSTVIILYYAIPSFSSINAPAHQKRHFMQLGRLPMKYSGAPLYDGNPPTLGIIFCEFLNTPLAPQTHWTQSKTTGCF